MALHLIIGLLFLVNYIISNLFSFTNFVIFIIDYGNYLFNLNDQWFYEKARNSLYYLD